MPNYAYIYNVGKVRLGNSDNLGTSSLVFFGTFREITLNRDGNMIYLNA